MFFEMFFGTVFLSLFLTFWRHFASLGSLGGAGRATLRELFCGFLWARPWRGIVVPFWEVLGDLFGGFGDHFGHHFGRIMISNENLCIDLYGHIYI